MDLLLEIGWNLLQMFVNMANFFDREITFLGISFGTVGGIFLGGTFVTLLSWKLVKFFVSMFDVLT